MFSITMIPDISYRPICKDKTESADVTKMTDNGNRETKRRNRAATSPTDVTGVWPSAYPQA